MKKLFRHNALLTTDFESLPCLEHVPAVGELLGWPIIVKPAIGSGTMHTHRIDSAEHFHALQAAHKLAGLEQVDTPLLAERFVPVEMEYHCDALVHEGKVVFASVSRIIDASLTPGRCFILGTMGDFCGSQILPEGHPARQPVLDLNARVIKALGLGGGVTHLEVLYANGSFFVGEIAVRPGGGGVLEAIRLHYGVDLWQAYIDSALGRAPRLAIKRGEGITGGYGLPARNGSIRSATPLEVLRSMPGVVDVKMFYQPGDTVQEKLTSVFYIGILYFHFDHESQLMSLNKALRGQYHLEIEDGPVSQQVAV
jgi:biotin carboxylase